MFQDQDAEIKSGYASEVAGRGFWAAVVTTVLLIFSGVTASTALKIPSLITGLLLVPAFVLLMVFVHEWALPGKKAFTLLGLMFSLGYAVLISLNYYMQLTLVAKGFYSEDLAMDNPRSIMWAIELLGYGFMGLATFFASLSLGRNKLERTVRWLFIANGVLGVGGAIGFAVDLRPGILLGGLVAWDVIMPAATILLAINFWMACHKR